jgi:hypothetical protein
MLLRKVQLAIVVLLCAAPLLAEEPKPAPPLSPEQFDKLHRMLLPAAGELKWMTAGIPWQTSLVEARKQAAAEDKPILQFVGGGAGFQNPIGVC